MRTSLLSYSECKPDLFTNYLDILVPASRERDDDRLVLLHARRKFQSVSDCVGRLKRGENPFFSRKGVKRFDRLLVRGGDVPCHPRILEVRVLRTHPGVVESRRDAVGPAYLSLP